MQETRKAGYFWVKLRGEWCIGEYIIGGMYGARWELTGVEVLYTDADFELIDENQITREPLFKMTTSTSKTIELSNVPNSCLNIFDGYRTYLCPKIGESIKTEDGYTIKRIS